MASGHSPPSLLRRSLRAKITLGVAVPLVVLLGAFSYLQYRRQRKAMLDELSQVAAYSALVIENNLRHEMMERDLDGVEELFRAMGEPR